MLSSRLSLIASLVPDGARVVDVGTDHAYLPIELIKSGKARSVIATDIRKGPLDKANANIKAAGVRGIKTILSDGVTAVDKDSFDTLVIAGMGGDTAVHILSDCPELKREGITLILQVMSSADVLRDYLAESGFFVETEPCVLDSGRVYSIMLTHFDGKKRTLTGAERAVGKTPFYSSEYNEKYIEKALFSLGEKERALRSAGKVGQADKVLKTIEEIRSM